MRNFLIAIIILLWLILGWLFYQNQDRCCMGDSNAPKPETTIHQNTGPLLFSYNSSAPITGDGWPAMRDSLSVLITDTTSLEISTWYCTNLTPPETELLGITRGKEIKMLFAENLRDRISIVASAINCADERMNTNDVSASFTQRVKPNFIQEVADKTIIYFAYNSTSKLNNVEVEAYLDNVAARVKATGESITLTGHTDDIGQEETNLALGQKRGEKVKQYLISKGVPTNNISVISKGESAPIADNSTEEGRAKNRRTELQIFQ